MAAFPGLDSCEKRDDSYVTCRRRGDGNQADSEGRRECRRQAGTPGGKLEFIAQGELNLSPAPCGCDFAEVGGSDIPLGITPGRMVQDTRYIRAKFERMSLSNPELLGRCHRKADGPETREPRTLHGSYVPSCRQEENLPFEGLPARGRHAAAVRVDRAYGHEIWPCGSHPEFEELIQLLFGQARIARHVA